MQELNKAAFQNQIEPREPLHDPVVFHKKSDEDYLDLRLLLILFWKKKWLIVLSVLFTTAISVLYALLAPPFYSASVLMMPVVHDEAKGLSAITKNLGGLGSLVGINESSNRAETNLAILNSRQFLTQFIQDQNLLPELFPARMQEANLKTQPDLIDGYEAFKKILKTSMEKKSSLITLTIEWTDGQQAADWANALVKAVNAYLRNDAVSDSKNSILYLQKLAAETQEIEIREVIYHLLSSEVQSSKVANIRADYAFKVIDPAVKPKLISKPNKKFIVMMGFIIGLLGSLVVIAFKEISFEYIKGNNS